MCSVSSPRASPIRRGRWIREKLLAGYVMDVPITVQAVIPDSDTMTLRERFAVVHEPKCWGCHKKMNPLGMPFGPLGILHLDPLFAFPLAPLPLGPTGNGQLLLPIGTDLVGGESLDPHHVAGR